MDLDRTPPEIASAAAEEIRALNHRSLDPKAFTQPSVVSDTAANLAALVQRLPQAFQQMEAGLTQLEQTTGIRMDDGTDPAVAAELARSYLRTAREGLDAVLEDLRHAASGLGRMGSPWTDDEPDVQP